jgi:hypothetical protein
MTTLAEITAGLNSLGDKQDETTSAVQSLTAKFSAQAEAAELAGLKGLNAKKAGIASGATASVEPVAKPAKAKGGGLRGGALAGAGLGLAALGGGLLKSAGGIAALGVAIPMFFGGLMIGSKAMDVAVDVMGASYNMEGLKKAALGFAGIVEEMPKSAMIALAGLMGISMVGGKKAALGLSFMGMGITGFLGGLLLGNTLLEKGGDMIGADFDFKATGRALKGFSGMIMNLSKESVIALAGILAVGVVTSMTRLNKTKMFTGALGLGAAIMGILGGLAVGDALLDAGEKKGLLSLDFSSTSKMFKGFSDSIGSLSQDAVIALVGILGVGGLFGKLKGKTKLGIVTAMTAIGAGISGLMIGLTAGDAAMQWIQDTAGSDGSALAGSFQMFNDSVGALNNENAIKALIGILGAGAGIGAIVGSIGGPGAAVGAGLGIFAVMTGIGAGIAGLMVGLTVGDVAISWINKLKGSGGGIVSIFEMFNDSITAITPAAIKRMTEISDLKLGDGLKHLLEGVTAFFKVDVKEGVATRFRNFFRNMFGKGDEDLKDGVIHKLVREFEPLQGEKGVKTVNAVKAFANALDPLANALQKMQGLEVAEIDFKSFAKNMSEGTKLMSLVANGQYTDNEGNVQTAYYKGRNIYFPQGGLMAVDNLDQLAKKMNQVRMALGMAPQQKGVMISNTDPVASGDGGGDTDYLGTYATTIVKFAPEALSSLTEAIMQSDFRAQSASAAPVVITQPNPNAQNGNGSGDTVVLTSKPAAVDPKVHSPADAAAMLGY